MHHKLFIQTCKQYKAKQIRTYRIYPILYTHGRIFLSIMVLILHVLQEPGILLPISLRLASLAPGQSYDCSNASEVTLKDMDQNTTK